MGLRTRVLAHASPLNSAALSACTVAALGITSRRIAGPRSDSRPPRRSAPTTVVFAQSEFSFRRTRNTGQRNCCLWTTTQANSTYIANADLNASVSGISTNRAPRMKKPSGRSTMCGDRTMKRTGECCKNLGHLLAASVFFVQHLPFTVPKGCWVSLTSCTSRANQFNNC